MNRSPANPSRIILASSSPRRRYLLEQAGLTFTVIPSTVDESLVPEDTPQKHVRLLAEAKAKEISESYPESWVIGADTLVLIDGNILGKPDSETRARQMLETLSGKTHRVLTSFCVCCKSNGRTFSETVESNVLFKTLSDGEIDWYIRTGEPFDKAGGYAVQGLGSFFVKRIEGSYTNVVGLPICEVMEYLLAQGVVKL